MKRILAVLTLWLAVEVAQAANWVRAGLNTNVPVWGVRGGLLWAVSPGGFRPRGEPRGLIRLGAPVLTNGGYALVNFIAIEPVVKGRRGFSELEQSDLDRAQGKRLWAVSEAAATNRLPRLVPGNLARLAGGAEQLDVILRVEPFENGAKVRLVISQRSDAPDEIKFAVHAEPDSAPLDECILTATMGNLVRTRQLWLKDEVVGSRALYANHSGDGFAPHTIYALDRIRRTPESDVLVAVTTDEDAPASVFPFPDTRRWHYGGCKVTQYWKMPRAMVRDDLRAVVNARGTYWQTRQPIPGGVAFENFELCAGFVAGQEFIFGITRRTPEELGLARKSSAAQSRSGR